MTITAETLKTCKMVQSMHFRGHGFFGHMYRCIEHPRLQRMDKCIRKTRSVEVSWWVDGAQVADFDAAIAALNSPVVLTAAQQVLFDKVPAEWTDLRKDPAYPFDVMHALADKGVIEYESGKCRRKPLS